MGENTTVNEALLKDDLYQAVNGEWLKTAIIPADKATTGGFADLADNIEETLMADFSKVERLNVFSFGPKLLRSH